MCNFYCFVRENVDDLGLPTDGFRLGKIAALKVGMTVKVITWFGDS